MFRGPFLTTRFAWIIAGVVGIAALVSVDHHGARAQSVIISETNASDAIPERSDAIREQSDAIREAAQDRIDAARERADAAREEAQAVSDAARDEREALREERRALSEARHGEHVRITIPSTIEIETNS